MPKGHCGFQKGNQLGKLQIGKHPSQEIKDRISNTLKEKHRLGLITHGFYKGMPKEAHPNFGKHLADITKQKISASNKGKPKSLAHRQKLSEVKLKLFAEGKIISPWFKGGFYKFRGKLDATKYRKLKTELLKDYNYQCGMCGSRKKLEMHHIIQVAEDINKAYDKDNVVILCKECHKLTHYKSLRTDKKIIIKVLSAYLERLEYEYKHKI